MSHEDISSSRSRTAADYFEGWKKLQQQPPASIEASQLVPDEVGPRELLARFAIAQVVGDEVTQEAIQRTAIVRSYTEAASSVNTVHVTVDDVMRRNSNAFGSLDRTLKEDTSTGKTRAIETLIEKANAERLKNGLPVWFPYANPGKSEAVLSERTPKPQAEIAEQVLAPVRPTIIYEITTPKSQADDGPKVQSADEQANTRADVASSPETQISRQAVTQPTVGSKPHALPDPEASNSKNTGTGHYGSTAKTTGKQPTQTAQVNAPEQTTGDAAAPLTSQGDPNTHVVENNVTPESQTTGSDTTVAPNTPPSPEGSTPPDAQPSPAPEAPNNLPDQNADAFKDAVIKAKISIEDRLFKRISMTLGAMQNEYGLSTEVLEKVIADLYNDGIVTYSFGKNEKANSNTLITLVAPEKRGIKPVSSAKVGTTRSTDKPIVFNPRFAWEQPTEQEENAEISWAYKSNASGKTGLKSLEDSLKALISTGEKAIAARYAHELPTKGDRFNFDEIGGDEETVDRLLKLNVLQPIDDSRPGVRAYRLTQEPAKIRKLLDDPGKIIKKVDGRVFGGKVGARLWNWTMRQFETVKSDETPQPTHATSVALSPPASPAAVPQPFTNNETTIVNGGNASVNHDNPSNQETTIDLKNGIWLKIAEDLTTNDKPLSIEDIASKLGLPGDVEQAQAFADYLIIASKSAEVVTDNAGRVGIVIKQEFRRPELIESLRDALIQVSRNFAHAHPERVAMPPLAPKY